MKQIIVAIAMLILAGTSSVFAGEENIAPGVLKAFKTEFSHATEVTWIAADTYYRAEFTMSGQKVFAYYSTDGVFIGLARFISTMQLPIQLLSELKNDHSGYWVSDLFEVNNNDGTHYYITLENAGATIKLKSSNGSKWETYEKKRKV
ncbi:MAG: hypothetical protein EPN92_11225 [Chitinophagaceae bacterium]|nr:MAG: hypothetical protein EPN92_11225 [Chitinophagaceae bacterium]